MKFYNMAVSYGTDGGRVENVESTKGQWATRAEAEQLEQERNAYRDECITRGGRELQALCAKEQAINERDALLNERRVWRTENTLFRDRMNTAEEKLEHAAKDAVEMAKQVQDLVVTRTRIWRKAEKIIERYEGGKG